MRGIGIDWVSMGIFFAAYLLSKVRQIPLRFRYTILAVACAIIGVFRLRFGLNNFNGIFTAIAFGYGGYYLYKAAKAPDDGNP